MEGMNVMPDRKPLDQTSFTDVLYKLAISLTSNLDLNELYQNIVNVGCELAKTSHGFIYVVNKEREVLELKVGTGIYTYYEGVSRNKEEPSVSSVVWNTGRLLAVGNLSQWEGRAQDRPYGGDIVKSVLGIPLHSGYEVIAVIGLGFETEKAQLTDEQLDLLSRFATLAALALNNARLYSALNTELLVQTEINKVQKAIMEQQINLYCQELVFAQGTGDSQAELPVESLAEHYALARRLRKTIQMQLADIYIGSSQMKPQGKKQERKFIEPLTRQEKTVLRLIAAGLSNQEIALDMGVTVNTVKTHANHLFDKLGVNRRAQALFKARELGLL
jgi:DNA-binding CsgD family transcriptional regulator